MRRTCGDRPVHLPNVVARLIFAGITRLRTGAGYQPEMITVENSVESASDRQLQRSESRSQ